MKLYDDWVLGVYGGAPRPQLFLYTNSIAAWLTTALNARAHPGVEFGAHTITVNDTKIKLQVWDTVSFVLVPCYYRARTMLSLEGKQQEGWPFASMMRSA